MSAKNQSECPSCTRLFDSERGMKVHHAKEHGESLAKESTECDYCSTQFEYYPSNQKGIACSDCRGEAISDGKDLGETEKCEECNSEVPIEPWEREWKDMFFCDMDCKAEFQRGKGGEGHPTWKGGYGNYYGPSWYEVREEVIDRDNSSCRICGKGEEEIGREPDVHHIVSVREYRNEYGDPDLANRPENLITLCPSHHHKVEKGDMNISVQEVASNVC